MPTIKSKLISGVVGNEVRNQKFRNEIGLAYEQQLSYMVFETKVDDAIYYCCWSGGVIENGEPKLTEIGRAALEVLSALPVGNDDALYFQQLKIGATPLKKKVIRMLKEKPRGSKVCFVGDMSGELDGQMHLAFNLKGQKELKIK